MMMIHPHLNHLIQSGAVGGTATATVLGHYVRLVVVLTRLSKLPMVNIFLHISVCYS